MSRLFPGLLLLLVACHPPDATVVVRVSFQPELGIQQLRLTATLAGESRAPQTRPEVKGPALTSGESIRLHFQQADLTRHARIDIEGLTEGRVVASGFFEVELRAEELDVVARLE